MVSVAALFPDIIHLTVAAIDHHGVIPSPPYGLDVKLAFVFAPHLDVSKPVVTQSVAYLPFRHAMAFMVTVPDRVVLTVVRTE